MKRQEFSDPNLTLPLEQASLKALRKKTIPTWPVFAAPLLALLAPSQGIEKSVQFLIAV